MGESGECKEHRDLFGAMGLFCILFMTMRVATKLSTFVKMYRAASLTQVSFTVYTWYLFGGIRRVYVGGQLSRDHLDDAKIQ